ncbi:pentapeptide repeat-containing protein [Microlunatus elymi]|uniref:Pentapeptide repeat-containing protein n=1 Tax=Microlunatus elymi TaxID=2596828 RepID=A0A516Q2C9_9ACTN|nr:pentapeptide repeat-containing protein [Microlunatus elymi]QDP97532.1 pentapeptide repeat-containing protein [Microlunatus elymi]
MINNSVDAGPDRAPRPPLAPRTGKARPAADAPTGGDDLIMNAIALAGVDLAALESDYAEASGSRFADVTLASSNWRHAAFADCSFSGCDLANAEFVESGWQRVEVRHSRMLGLQASGCSWKNVVIADTMINLANLRFLQAERVRFENCVLAGTDFGSSRLVDVVFADCDLTEAEFSNASLSRVRFERCRLVRIGGVAGLAGATVDRADLLELAETLAAALGIGVDDGSTQP